MFNPAYSLNIPHRELLLCRGFVFFPSTRELYSFPRKGILKTAFVSLLVE